MTSRCLERPSVCLGMGLAALDVVFETERAKPIFFAGGSCGNVLTILSYLGWNSHPIIRLGNDAEGKHILEDMKRWGVKIGFVNKESGIHSPRIIERVFLGKTPRHRFYVKCDHGNPLPRRKPYLLKTLDQIRDRLPVPSVFYFDRADPSAYNLARYFKGRGSVVVFEPTKFLQKTIFCKCLEVADIVKHCRRKSNEIEISNVRIPLEIQTMGDGGLRYKAQFLKHTSWKSLGAFPVPDLIDAAGSGDWLTAGLIHSIRQNTMETLSQKKLESALNFGQALASLNCSFVGARGIMYNLTRSRLLSLSTKTINARKTPKIGVVQDMRIKHAHTALGCRVCLCSGYTAE